MHVLLVNNSPIPVYGYGGTERVIWDLGQMLVRLGHRVSYLVPEGSTCDFGAVLPIRPDAPWDSQIPADVDITHFQFNPRTEIGTPYLVTEHGNARKPKPLPRNTVFLSRDHAARYGSTEFVYNGLQWESYGAVDFARPRDHYHFLGKAAWRVKNVSGAIRVAKLAGVELDVLGGDRINFRRGFRWTLSRRIHFFGMVGGAQKTERLNASRGLIFPVRWHEPFGLAVIESLYFGCPVFSTPYGALPELVPAECGVLADNAGALAEAVRANRFDPRACHDHAVRHFGAERMARDYLRMYERVLAGETLNAQAPVIQGEARSLAWRN
ncbi:glycosyltransferase [Acidovorax sp. NCPPB 3576]|uniref:glycosyltransferase n=1 Tax=Acidovorax sp. NCPPB 3576 TaxID=2940488 RepID=UPI00234B5AE4|nr:glycosyltransferase [Acidovorax sp. NCPPB 3576]WCM88115.1 glycosyltransferase [Acidovorax sp. NCPPB 3576]